MHWWEQAKPIFAHREYSATGMRDHWVSFMVPASLKLNQTAFYPKVCGQMQRNLGKKWVVHMLNSKRTWFCLGAWSVPNRGWKSRGRSCWKVNMGLQHTKPFLSILSAPQQGLWSISESLCFPACPEYLESGKKLWSPRQLKQGAVAVFGLPVLFINVSCGGYPSRKSK